MFEPTTNGTGTTNTGFAAYIRLTLLNNHYHNAYAYSLRSSYRYSNIIDLSSKTEESFGWRIQSMKPTVAKVGLQNSYGVIIVGEVIGEQLLELFSSNGLTTYFIVTAAGSYERHQTRATHWAYVPKLAKHHVHYSVAENGASPAWEAFNIAINRHLCMVALSV